MIDKTRYGAGPWQDEPDTDSWTTHAGLPARVHRAYATGTLCGYVRVTAAQWAQLTDREERARVRRAKRVAELQAAGVGSAVAAATAVDLVPEAEPDDWDDRLDVHGGVTFTGSLEDEDKGSYVWIGFDCAHSGDVMPLFSRDEFGGMLATMGEYRDISYVRTECERLAEQIVEYLP